MRADYGIEGNEPSVFIKIALTFYVPCYVSFHGAYEMYWSVATIFWVSSGRALSSISGTRETHHATLV
jgi:hypothetical protein